MIMMTIMVIVMIIILVMITSRSSLSAGAMLLCWPEMRGGGSSLGSAHERMKAFRSVRHYETPLHRSTRRARGETFPLSSR